MRACIDSLPHSCLLTLCTGEGGPYSLAEALRRVRRGSPRSVWVDCRHITALPAEALQQLRQCASHLWEHGGYVALCHAPEAVRAALPLDTSQPLAASLLDAQQYGLDCPPPRAQAR